MNLLMRCIASGKKIGSVGTYLHSERQERNGGLFRKTHISYGGIRIDVWSPDSGTVEDFCGFFLGKIRVEPAENWETITSMYRDRVDNWKYNPLKY